MTDDETLKELKKISKILTMAHGEQHEKELAKIATTDDRKRIWVLINGELTPEEISRQTSIINRNNKKLLDNFQESGID